jgi:hypothetical protein
MKVAEMEWGGNTEWGLADHSSGILVFQEAYTPSVQQ